VRRPLAATYALALALAAPGAGADDLPDPPSACTVARHCSASGIECESDDRACRDRATASGLEVVCDRASGAGYAFVYCPAGASARDSRVVWILLAVAFAIAAVGGGIFWGVLRKRS
jgi:hypothetical protein